MTGVLTIFVGGAIVTVVLPIQRLKSRLGSNRPVPYLVPAAAQSPFVVHLPQGSIEILAVSGDPGDGASWWKPDGSLGQGKSFNLSPADRSKRPEVQVKEGQRSRARRQIILRGHGLPQDASWSAYPLKHVSGFSYNRVLGTDGQEGPSIEAHEGAARRAAGREHRG